MFRKFHLGAILSITHDRLVAPNHMDDIYAICNYLTGDNLFTHQLLRVHGECKAELLRQHPDLNAIPIVTDEEVLAMKLVNGKPKQWWIEWLDTQVGKFGEYRDVEPMPKGIHEFKDPITEAVEMVGKDRVIVVREDEK